MVRIRKNTVRLSGFIALFCLSLACFTYINSIRLETQKPQETIYVEEITPEDAVLPDVDLIKRLVRKAFEFMSMTNL
ncbi:MAG TPA: hypothetical protein VFF90_08230 [Saprospiraceae bacterium]|nr:hypothetical protein [Saprospiraceae bacterium]